MDQAHAEVGRAIVTRRVQNQLTLLQELRRLVTVVLLIPRLLVA